MEEVGGVDLYCGVCPDSHCGNVLYFIPNIYSDVECTNCGQRHTASSLLNVKQTDGTSAALGNFLKSMLFNHSATKKGSELVKVRGLSNYHCKLVSPFLTSYGMDKANGQAKLLSDLGQPKIFDCSVFANRAFLIEEDHLEIEGYGKDKSGSLNYLGDTLELINKSNDYKTLVPLHVDGDGHCLVHAISRSVVGRELLWHSLRQNLHDHLQRENTKYSALFHDFIDNDEWVEIIAEADPDFYPITNEPFGLRNIHVFGLANVLHRPIILLDSIEGMQSSGDYSGIFLPALFTPDKCKTDNVLNKPLVIAWSSSARNHYVPLVGIKGKPLSKIHKSLLPKAWGLPNQLIPNYIDFDESECCIIGGPRSLQESYIDRLVLAMDSVFFEKHHVCPELVAEVNQFICKPLSVVSMSLAQVIQYTQDAVQSETLYRCLACHAVQEEQDDIPKALRRPGGNLYKMAEESQNGLIADAVYTFKDYDQTPCIYSVREDMLQPLNDKKPLCTLCNGALREVYANGTVKYVNGDHTLTASESSCGFKHYWDGKEHDNLPKSISVLLEWGGKKIEETIFWFDMESDPILNSNAYEIATGVVQKHFPGEFGSEVLVRKVVDKILRETAVKQSEEEANPQLAKKYSEQEKCAGSGRVETPTKIILTGPKKKTLHKEELNKSETEKLTRARIAHHTAYSQSSQKRKNAAHIGKGTGNSKQGKQETHLSKAKLKPKQSASQSSTITTLAGSNTTQTVPTTAKNTPGDRKIRLSSSDGRQATVTLKPSATYGDLQDSVFEQFGITKERQKFRYGFPPRELTCPEDVTSALPLSHGDRVTVEELPVKMEQEEEQSSHEEGVTSDNMETTTEMDKWPVQETGSAGAEFTANREQLASDLQNLLKALNADHWGTMQHQPELFTRGGYIYERVVGELGPLQDDQHCSILELPGKKFAYNAQEDRLELCLGQQHVPVQPLDAATLAQSKTGGTAAPREEGLGAFSGAVRHRDVSEGRSAFSGTGRTLGGSAVSQDEKENAGNKSHSTNVSNMDVASGENMTSRENDVVTVPGALESTGVETMRDMKDNEGCEEMMVDDPLGETQKATTVKHEDISDARENVSETNEETCATHEDTIGTHENMREEASDTQGNISDQHEKSSVTNEEAGGTHDLMIDTHEDSDMHEIPSIMDEETGVAHGQTSDKHENVTNTYEKRRAANEDTDVVHEEISDTHEDVSNTHEQPSAMNEETSDTHEKPNEHDPQISNHARPVHGTRDVRELPNIAHEFVNKRENDPGDVSAVSTEPTNSSPSGDNASSIDEKSPANELNYLGSTGHTHGSGITEEAAANERLKIEGNSQSIMGAVGDTSDSNKQLGTPGCTITETEQMMEKDVTKD